MSMKHSPYHLLALMAGLHVVAMFVLMYAMVNTFVNTVPNINFLYMGFMMTAPMLILEMLLMGMMYKDKRLNKVVILIGFVILVVSFLMIRYQTFVGDKGFLQSMIPHHSGALLMCEKAKITDSEIQQLCANIITGQKQEIDQMNEILKRL